MQSVLAGKPGSNYQADLGNGDTAMFNWYNAKLTYWLRVYNLTHITASRMRLGSSDGPIVAYLYGPTSGKSTGIIDIQGLIYSDELKGPLHGKSVSTLVAEMDKGNVWVDVATKEQPYGAVDGHVYRKKA